MRMRGAQNEAVSHAGERHVGDVAAVAFDQAGILEAGNGLADCKFTHYVPHLSLLDGSADPPPRPVRTMPGASIKAAGHRELRLLHGPAEGFNPALNWLFKPAARDCSLRVARQ